MKHIKTLTNKTLQNTVKKGGCGEQRLPSLLILRMEFELERGTEKQWFTSIKIMDITWSLM